MRLLAQLEQIDRFHGQDLPVEWPHLSRFWHHDVTDTIHKNGTGNRGRVCHAAYMYRTPFSFPSTGLSYRVAPTFSRWSTTD